MEKDNKKQNNRQVEQNSDEPSTTNKVIAMILAIAILVVAVIGITYAAFTYTKGGTKENTITTGTVTMDYKEGDKAIKITDAYPISDAIGEAFTDTALGSDLAGTIADGYAGVFDFNVSATMTSGSIAYDILGTKQVQEKDLDSSAVKVYLQKASDEGMTEPTVALSSTLYSDLKDANAEAGGATTDAGKATGTASKVLYSSTFNTSETHYYRLKMWVDEDYGNTDAEGESFSEAKTFALKVDVYGQAIA